MPILLFIFLLMSLSVPALATENYRPGVEELEERFSILVEEPQRWDERDLRSLLKGAEAVPVELWQALAGPHRVEYVARPCLFAMGRYSESCPTFGEDGRFFIYDSAPVAGEGPVEALAVLRREEQRDLQVRRAVVHLAMVQVDELARWSEDPWWRSINSWPRRPGRPAMNQDPWGYSRYLGMRSARMDLVTFAEEYFVRPEDLLIEKAEYDGEALGRLQAFDPDHSMACQQFTKRRIFGERLRELIPDWKEPRRRLPHLELGEPECPAFTTWARPDLVEDFDILLAAPTARQPESLYGHLLLHVRYGSDGLVQGQGFEPVYQFGAVTATNVSRVEYFARGLLGGFPSILELNTFRGVDRVFLQFQQRNLRRFTLALTEDQKLHFLQRIWEGERRIRYPYIFLPQNCASFLVDLLAPVVNPGLPQEHRGIVMPTDVLDNLANHRNGNGEPLLVKRADTLRSNRELAEEAVLKRRALGRSMIDELRGDRLMARALERLLRDLDRLEPGQRAGVYEEAAQVFDALLKERPEFGQQVIDFLYQSVLIERYFMELAHYGRRAVYLAASTEVTHLTIADQLAQRREIYRTEDLGARIQAFNEQAAQMEGLLQNQQREFTEEEEQILEYERQARRTYTTVLQIQSGIIAAYYPDWNGVEYLDARAQAYFEEMKRIDERSLGASGRHRFRGGAGFEAMGGHPTLELSYSMIEDRLGEIRRRGYHSNLESRILGVDFTAPLGLEFWRQMQLELVVFRYASMSRTYGPIRRGFHDSLGWSVDLRARHDGRRGLLAGLEVTPELLYPLWTGKYDIHHLVLHGGLALRYDVHREQTPLLGGVAGLLGQLHLYGDFANVARFGVQTGHYTGLDLKYRPELSARVETRHILLRLRKNPLIVAPFTEYLWTTRDYREEAPGEGFRAWQVGVQVELPL